MTLVMHCDRCHAELTGKFPNRTVVDQAVDWSGRQRLASWLVDIRTATGGEVHLCQPCYAAIVTAKAAKPPKQEHQLSLPFEEE